MAFRSQEDLLGGELGRIGKEFLVVQDGKAFDRNLQMQRVNDRLKRTKQ
jgi:hypothetical protein